MSKTEVANIKEWEVETLAPYFGKSPAGLRAEIATAREGLLHLPDIDVWIDPKELKL